MSNFCVSCMLVGVCAVPMSSCVRFHSSDKLDTVGKVYSQPVPDRETSRQIYRLGDRYFVHAKVVKSSMSYPVLWELACYGEPDVRAEFTPLPDQGISEYAYAPISAQAADWLQGKVKDREFSRDEVRDRTWIPEQEFDLGKATVSKAVRPVTSDFVYGERKEEKEPSGVLLKPLVYLDFVAVDIPLSVVGTVVWWLSRPVASLTEDH